LTSHPCNNLKNQKSSKTQCGPRDFFVLLSLFSLRNPSRVFLTSGVPVFCRVAEPTSSCPAVISHRPFAPSLYRRYSPSLLGLLPGFPSLARAPFGFSTLFPYASLPTRQTAPFRPLAFRCFSWPLSTLKCFLQWSSEFPLPLRPKL